MSAPTYPPPRQGIPRITQSALETYLRCGIRYDFEREHRAARHATVRMLIGSAVAAGASVDNRSKIFENQPASLSRIVDASVAEYEKDAGESCVPDAPFEVAKGKDDSAAAARAFGLQVSPQLPEVLAAEVPLLAVVRGIEIAGTPDYITPLGLGDLKTGRARTQKEADRSHQLSVYALLHRLHRGSYPDKVWLDSLSHHGSRGWLHERLWSTRGTETTKAILMVIESAVKGIKAGVALPAPEGSWFCSKEWCCWWNQCPAVGNA